MSTLTTQVVGQTGATISFANASGGGDACSTGDGVRLLVQNGGESSTTVTLVTPGKVDGDLDIADRTFAVAAGAFGAIPVSDRYRTPSTGLASVTCSPTTDVSLAVIR